MDGWGKVENYVPGKLKELGLSYEICAKINPKLIYASITGLNIVSYGHVMYLMAYRTRLRSNGSLLISTWLRRDDRSLSCIRTVQTVH